MKRLTAIGLLLFCICLLTSCSCKHEWEEATCTAPQTCRLCHKTTGELLAHSWEDATCSKPKTCRLCHKTTGEPLAHNWVDASCEEPKHCTLCNLVEGDKLEHQWSALTCDEEYVCTICNDASAVSGPHVDVRNITQDINNNLLVKCKCGHEEILTIEELMLQLLQGKWTLRAVQKDNSLLLPDPQTNWQEGTWLEFPSLSEPIAYEVGTSAQGENFAFQQDLQDFQLTNAVLYANGPQLAVLMCNTRTEYGDGVYTNVPMILVFGDRNYAKEGIDDNEFINAALKGSIISLWRHSDNAMYIYGYDVE